ncbi:unnamed protein product [Parajaminaea phylloscopi]
MPTISAMPPPLPGPSGLLKEVTGSCLNAMQSAGVSLDADVLDEIVAEYTAQTSGSSSSTASVKDYALALPLRWDSVAAEVNFIALIAIVSVLSPLQVRLDQLPASPAPPTPASLARHLLLGLYLSAPATNHATTSSPLSSSHLAVLADGEIADILGLKIHEEKRVEHIPVATLAERGGPGSDIVDKLREVLNHVGDKLVQSRYVDLGALVMETLAQCKGVAASKGDEEAVGHFVHRMVSALPEALSDSVTLSSWGEQQVHLYKNALFILLALTLRFSPTAGQAPEGGESLPWLPARGVFGMVCDGELPADLARRGAFVLQPGSGSLELRRLFTPSKQPLDPNEEEADNAGKVCLTSDEAHILRAATVAAGEGLRSRLGSAGAAVIDFDAFLRRSRVTDADRSSGSVLRVEETQCSTAGSW